MSHAAVRKGMSPERQKKERGGEKSRTPSLCPLPPPRTEQQAAVRPLGTLVLLALSLKRCATRFFPAELPDIIQGASAGQWGEEGGRCTVYEPVGVKREKGRKETRCAGDSWERPCLHELEIKEGGS